MSHLSPPKPAYLIDGVAMNQAHPTTFEIPDRQHLAALMVKEAVKIGFDMPGRHGERFWVEITSITEGPNGRVFEGWIDNELENYPEHALGSMVSFEERHILCIERMPSSNLH
jgi:hypothetical protein